MLAAGAVDANDLAWIVGTPEWTRVGHVPGVIAASPDAAPTSDRTILPAFLLAFFFGVFGAHRFYVGRTGSAVVMLVLTLTLVGVVITGIWATIDWILIVCSAFRDRDERPLARWV
ncbi:MAG: TM2 domain-containing protein [Planctomycetes bacterium]|nr:TM2 domain-containing protein [Planctomycetota bacterium]